MESASGTPIAQNLLATGEALEKPQINPEDIRNFLRFLAHEHAEPDNEIFTFSLMDAESSSVIGNLGVFHGTIEDALRTLDLNPSSTLHVTLNRTNMKGRRTQHIQSARVLCVDLDREVGIDEIRSVISRYQPGMIVESSPQKFHIYWKLDSVLKLEMWSAWQLGMASHLAGDLSLRQVTHTIRVPGVPRIKGGQPVMPRIVYLNPAVELVSVPPWDRWDINIGDAIAAGEGALAEQTQIRRKVANALVKGKDLKALLATGEKLETGVGRNERMLCYLIDLCKHAHKVDQPLDMELLRNYAQAINLAFAKGPLPDDEIEGLCRKVLKRAGEFKEKLEENRLARKKRMEDLLSSVLVKPELPPNGVLVNGHSHEQSEQQVVSPATGDFVYDNSVGALKERPFSDEAILDRVLQRFNGSIIRTGKIVYAFDAAGYVWRSQKLTHELLHGYVRKCAKDALRDPRLVVACMKRVGKGSAMELCEEKLGAIQDKLYSHRIVSQTVSSLLEVETLVRMPISAFDSAPLVLFCANGVVDLIGGTVRAATPGDMLLRQSPVVFDGKARCPWFESFIAEVFAKNDDPGEMVRCMQEVFGYTITGDTEAQVMVVHCGEGANGKSRLMSVLASLLGDYSARLQAGALTKNKNSLEKEVARMGAKIEGKRVMIVDDLDTKTQWDSSLIKTLTDATIIMRNLYEEEKDIPNRATFHIGANLIPETEGVNLAMRRRFAVIPYKRTFEVDPYKAKEINRMIQIELPGILNWCIAGLQRVQARDKKNIEWAQEIVEATQLYWDANAGIEDQLEKILSEPLGPADTHSITEILTYVEDCARKTGLKCNVGLERLGRLLGAQGYKHTRVQTGKQRQRLYGVRFSQTLLDDL